ncbi:hypothetical protein BJ973_006017 [Actinoplanes tereljensis]|uniref:ABC transporter permease n=1 Tax=Paractinoplanes tereljensis TaxID=571912 RepID=A0A919NHX2_9ACTN|nr:hypothetical protein [Actinoplanes tereljensis]GIF18970.1 ABC transporter permease [Actinoplanes tereljensis]
MRPRALAALAMADFRERVRRPSYVVVLLAAVGLGYLAAPAAGAHWTILNAGAYRGVYNSAYIGTVTALAGALWLSTGGFYIIRTAIHRDRQTGVGQLLAATPTRAAEYLLGKFLSNLLLLTSMAGALAITAVAMQLARGESRAVDPVALLSPFLLCTLPVLAVTAAAAIFFETTPALRGGLGNVIWLFASLTGAIVGQSANAPLGGLGVGEFAASLRDQFAAQGAKLTEIGLGLMYLDDAPRSLLWTGVHYTTAFAGERTVLLLTAAAAAIVPALWFDRFDLTRAARGAKPTEPSDTAPSMTGLGSPTASSPPTAPGRPIFAGAPTRPAFAGAPGQPAFAGTPAPPGIAGAAGRPAFAALPSAVTQPLTPRRGLGGLRLVRGELRILTRGVSRWWWAGTAALVVAGLAAPVAARPLLMAAWIWPVLVWSRLGAQAREHGVDKLLDACPSPVFRTLAQWLAGAALTAAVGLGPGVAMAVDGHFADWLAGVAFIPAIALALGVISRTQRFFQAVYPLLWYLVINDIAGLDYMGVLPGGPAPHTVAAVATFLLLSALTTVAVRHRHR